MKGGTDRAQLGGKAVAGLIVALAVAALITALVLPIGIDAIENDKTSDLDLDTNDEVEVKGGLNATLEDTTADTSADINLSTDSDSESKTVNEGETEDYTVDGETLSVGVEDAGSDSAEFNVTYPLDFGWDSGASGLWGILAIIVVLAVFLMFIGIALSAANRV